MVEKLRSLRTDGFTAYKSEQASREKALKDKVYFRLSGDLKKLCDKVMRTATTKILRFEEKDSSIKAVIETFDKGTKIIEVPIQVNFEKESYSLPDESVLVKAVSKISIISKAEDIRKRYQEKSQAITNQKNQQIENYWNKIKSSKTEESVSKEEKMYEPDIVIKVNQIDLPKALKVGDIIPLSGIEYKITGEKDSEWILTMMQSPEASLNKKVDEPNPPLLNKEEKKEKETKPQELEKSKEEKEQEKEVKEKVKEQEKKDEIKIKELEKKNEDPYKEVKDEKVEELPSNGPEDQGKNYFDKEPSSTRRFNLKKDLEKNVYIVKDTKEDNEKSFTDKDELVRYLVLDCKVDARWVEGLIESSELRPNEWLNTLALLKENKRKRKQKGKKDDKGKESLDSQVRDKEEEGKGKEMRDQSLVDENLEEEKAEIEKIKIEKFIADENFAYEDNTQEFVKEGDDAWKLEIPSIFDEDFYFFKDKEKAIAFAKVLGFDVVDSSNKKEPKKEDKKEKETKKEESLEKKAINEERLQNIAGEIERALQEEGINYNYEKDLIPVVHDYLIDAVLSDNEIITEVIQDFISLYKEQALNKQSKGALPYPEIIDFRYFEGTKEYGENTSEYKELEKLDEYTWVMYVDVMSKHGVSVEYDAVNDIFEVKSLVGANLKIEARLKYDQYGRGWRVQESELCPRCGQPTKEQKCSHKRFNSEDVEKLNGILPIWERKRTRKNIPGVIIAEPNPTKTPEPSMGDSKPITEAKKL